MLEVVDKLRLTYLCDSLFLSRLENSFSLAFHKLSQTLNLIPNIPDRLLDSITLNFPDISLAAFFFVFGLLPYQIMFNVIL